MKALVKYATGPGGIEVQELPDPALIPGHVVIAVEACGICGTDLHIQAGEYPINPPVVLGHEFSGTVVEVAPDVPSVRVGQRVTSLVYFIVCGTCQFCQTGQWNLCAQRKSIGSGVNGAFARFVLVPARNVRQLPENVDFIAGAVTEPLACCAHGVLEKAKLHPGDFSFVTGPGAIGLLTSQILISAGVCVILAGTQADANRLDLARRLGVQHTLQVDTESISEIIQNLTHGNGVDLVFECSGAAAAARMGIQVAKRGGQYIQLGLFGKPLEINWDQAMMKEVDIRNSFASTWVSWEYALKLLESGKVQTAPLVSGVFPLQEWETAFERFSTRQGIKYILTPES
jgi:L-iditol 2-dehydrogenase